MQQEPSRVVVTGAQGLLGRHVVASALGRWPGARVVGLGRSPRIDERFTHTLTWRNHPVPAYLPESLRAAASNERYDYVRCDLCDPEAVAGLLAAIAPAVVFHVAAALRDEPWRALLATNVEGTAVLFSKVATLPAPPRVVLVSSGSVYGPGDGEPPFKETACCRPIEPYGVTKRAAEDVARVLGSDRGVPVTTARVFNLVGSSLQERHLPAVLAARLAEVAAGVVPPVITMQPLTATRDFVDVREAASACVGLVDHAPDVYNIASGVETPVRSVLELMAAACGLRDVLQVTELPSARPADLPRACADVARLASAGLLPAKPLAQTLAEMVDYYLRGYAD